MKKLNLYQKYFIFKIELHFQVCQTIVKYRNINIEKSINIEISK